jgi:acyl dehydratase
LTEKTRDVDWSEATGAKITPEHIERARLLIGFDEAAHIREHVATAQQDNIRNFALAYGCDNPLHCEPDYARKTRWGDVVAPGPMAITMGAGLRSDPRPEAMARAKKGLFKGIHQLHSGTEWEWFHPIRPGDTIYRFSGEESVEVKNSEFAGTSVLRTSRTVYFNQRAEVACVQRTLLIHSERDAAAKRGKYKSAEPANYTAEDLAAIDAIYAAEKVRGAELRYFEDVEVGDSLGAMAKGPLTVTDIVCFHTTGFAQLPWGPATSRVAYKRRQTMPAAFVKNSQGIPDIIMRMHWEDDWARALGSPMAYDYGFQRECWLYHYLTDWCGDDGVVLRLRDEIRKFNYLGDTQMITGEVVGKKVEDGHATVDVAVRFTSQRGETTVEATATVALPSRAHGEADYPKAPPELETRARAFLKRHHELAGG